MTIDLDPDLDGRGHSAVLDYQDQDGYVSRGSTNEGGLPPIPVLLVSMKELDYTVRCGPQEYSIWMDLKKRRTGGRMEFMFDPEANNFMWKVVLSSLNKDRFKEFLTAARLAGHQAGREEKRLEFVKILGE